MQMNIMQEQKTTHMTPAESTKPERRCYTVDEVMEFLGVGRKAVYENLVSGNGLQNRFC